MPETKTVKVGPETLRVLEEAAAATSPSTLVVEGVGRFTLFPDACLPAGLRPTDMSKVTQINVEPRE